MKTMKTKLLREKEREREGERRKMYKIKMKNSCVHRSMTAANLKRKAFLISLESSLHTRERYVKGREE